MQDRRHGVEGPARWNRDALADEDAARAAGPDFQFDFGKVGPVSFEPGEESGRLGAPWPRERRRQLARVVGIEFKRGRGLPDYLCC